MLATRRTGRQSGRRAMVARPRRRVYVGSAVTRRASRRVFLIRATQHMTARTRLGHWLGAALMLVGIAGWGMPLMLLGA